MQIGQEHEPYLAAVDLISTVLDTVGALILVLDRDGRVVLLNRACERASGYSNEAARGLHVSELGLTSDGQTMLDRMLEGADTSSLEQEWVTRSGEHRIVEWTNSVIRSPDGQLAYLVCTGLDITERRRSERSLEEQLHLLQRIIDNIPSPIFYKSRDGLYRGCNQAFAEMLGFPREEIIGSSVYDLSPRELADHYKRMDDELFANPGVQLYEGQVRWADGSRHEVVYYKATYTDTTGALAGIVGVMLDITERKHAEAELQRAHEQLEARVRQRTAELERMKEAAEAADRTKSEFLNIASHELRTPLTSLHLLIQRSRRHLDAGRAVDAGTLARMERHTNRLIRMTEDLLDASRLEHGLFVLHTEPRDLRELVRSTVDDLRPMAADRDVPLLLPDAPAVAKVDADRIAQVLGNLLSNAFKYTPPGSPVEVTLTLEEERVRLCVADRGPGIPDEARARLFGRFSRLTSSFHQTGLGLGLYISREIIRQHGGDLEATPRAGDGSEFCFWLPREEGAEEDAAAQARRA